MESTPKTYEELFVYTICNTPSLLDKYRAALKKELEVREETAKANMKAINERKFGTKKSDAQDPDILTRFH